MRSFCAALVSIALCACSSSHGTKSQPQAEDVAALIASNDPKACAAQNAIDTALAAADQSYGDYLKAGGPPIRVDTVSATEIKGDIHEITCSAVAHYRTLLSNDEQTRPFVYKLRPTLDRAGSFVAEIPDVHEIAGAIESQMFWEQGQKGANQPQAQAASPNTADASASTSTPAEAPAQGGECSGRVLHDVNAIEDPSSVMHAGQTWPNITQYWQNDKTGEAHFCAHGDYCYPARVNVAGKQVEAIKLTNCSIGKKVDQDGDDDLYSVG